MEGMAWRSDYGDSLFIFFLLMPLRLNETGPIGFRTFPGEKRMEEMAENFAY